MVDTRTRQLVGREANVETFCETVSNRFAKRDFPSQRNLLACEVEYVKLENGK